MPTGTAMRDARERLFDAAERVLLRDGPSALTSRAVTDEADCAKGVLHRHFADFDAFLAELVADRIARVETCSASLRDRAGTGTVADNLAGALTDLFGPVAVTIVGLVTSRDGLRARLRRTTPTGVPLLTEAAAGIAAYLARERERGRLADEADIDTLAPTLIGAGHLLFADRGGTPPGPEAVHRVVTAVIADVVREPPP
ncbi:MULTISPECIES: TetR/AcrR family transcriptional regulator [Nocardiopsis]|uniref:Transcriptional regulator, TetR family n=1 Tax=Nocardiopsis dassonvillei (strain ATCC 23218 / DSM 43111 / CIP 107115 / JCM 7437 / KCTC 9190 / NBRC 14626 / NCTC 10488 / NRRL B-5397 / IMRU 509) TaxID=446468 RepID=D7AUK6_NOCDD|nr:MULTISPECIES: TetR/AcrR family transcriptional regulator [Nocardiopsis]ADH67586.1 transcriptional regulator, TetR family [Nocardiopsis dassonvillei subsp. dassonvillei DSM 43111]APC35774.1 TetR family transcriptional regulator [Nocardiopsis dassonvillei]NKY77576.1 TetR/AcrR family transcriptional regulator [Nocardiopsis dassonvillei]VEI87931.1 TetR family transcriptional regulator [Nocardiopsis dassonvillei]